MRTFGVFAALVLLIPIGAFADCAAPPTIKELQQCWQDNWNAKKLDSVMQLYAADATLHTFILHNPKSFYHHNSPAVGQGPQSTHKAQIISRDYHCHRHFS
jgi:hypothetical protein